MSKSFYIGLFLACVAVQMPAQTLSFRRQVLETGVSAKSVHIADFNGDGKADVAVLNTGELDMGSVAVMLRTSTGFSAPVVTSTGGIAAWSMATGDFNQDGKMDVAVVNNASGNVSIMLGNGDGTFRIGGYYATHLSPNAITAADLNGDGHLDLAVVNGGSGDLTILLGKGNGTFTTGASIYLGSSPTDVVAADFNADGIQDLAVTNGVLGLQVVVVLLGNGDGSFRVGQSLNTDNEPIALVAGQFSQNGKADLAVANLVSNDISLLAGAGNGTFQPAVSYSTGNGPSGIAAADFNRDSKLDLVVCNDVSNNVSVYLGHGDGTFQPAISLATGSSPTSIAVGDLNHDGRRDIATAGPEGVVLLLNTTH